MKLLEVLVQGEDIEGTRKLRLLPGTTAGELKGLAALLRRHETGDTLFLFEENTPTPLEDEVLLREGPYKGKMMHLHRARSVAVTLCRGPSRHVVRFAPGVTFGHILSHLQQTGVAPKNAGAELFLAGTQTRPAADRHLGSFVFFPFSELVLELRIPPRT